MDFGSKDDHEDNIVQFPNNGTRTAVETQTGPDPLEQLLNEFNDISENWEYDLDIELDLNNSELSNEDSDKHRSNLKDREVLELMGDQLRILQESGERMQYYLSEISQFLPKK